MISLIVFYYLLNTSADHLIDPPIVFFQKKKKQFHSLFFKKLKSYFLEKKYYKMESRKKIFGFTAKASIVFNFSIRKLGFQFSTYVWFLNDGFKYYYFLATFHIYVQDLLNSAIPDNVHFSPFEDFQLNHSTKRIYNISDWAIL